MAIKKRVSLREKSVRKTIPTRKPAEIVLKRKILDKTAPVNPKTGVSKSAIRRRKRKMRDQLPAKFTDDMLSALTTSTNTKIEKKNGVESISIGKSETVKLDHRPNPVNARGRKVITKMENERFKQVLKANIPSNGLRDAILLNMSKFKE